MSTSTTQNWFASLLAALRRPSITNRPPTTAELRRNDLALLVVVVLAFVIGLGVRNLAWQVSKPMPLGDGLPTIRYPADWLTRQPEFLHFQAINPASPSSYDAQVDVFVRDLKPEETLEMARARLGLQRGQELVYYRELSSDPVTVLHNQPALLTHYAHVADPARDNGGNGLPIVVEGQDLLFFQDNKLVIITLAADANNWAAEQRHFQIVLDSLALQTQTVEPIETTPTEGSAE
jgi:hypothetical protein